MSAILALSAGSCAIPSTRFLICEPVGVSRRSRFAMPRSIWPNRRRIFQQEVSRAAGRVVRIRDLSRWRALVKVVVLIVGRAGAIEHSTDRAVDACMTGRVTVAAAKSLPWSAAFGSRVIERARYWARIATKQRSWSHARLCHVARFAAVAASSTAHAARSQALAADARHRERHGQRRVQSPHQIVPLRQ